MQLPLALSAGAFWYSSGGAVWYAGRSAAAWPVLLLLAMWPLHWLANGLRLRPTLTDLFLALFLLSAGVSVWAAYDRGPAWAKFWLIVGAVGLYYAYAHQYDESARRLSIALLGAVGAGLAAYFVAAHDWEASPTKVRELAALGKSLSEWIPAIGGHSITPNVAGGILATLLPYCIPLIAWTAPDDEVASRGPWRYLARGLWVLCASAAALGLLVTASRGAWIALCGTIGLWALWRTLGHWEPTWLKSTGNAHRTRALVGGLALLLAGALAAFGATIVLARGLPGADALTGRLELLSQGTLLARDYVFTGIGLGMFEMQYAIYTLLLHVGYIVNSHNLFLDLAIEQGIVGLGLLLGFFFVGIRRGVRALEQTPRWNGWLIESAIASMAIALTHGLVDDVLYGSRGMLLLFVPLGVLAAATRRGPGTLTESAMAQTPPRDVAHRWPHWAWLLPIGVLVVGSLLGWRIVVGAWHANMGALAQARVELNTYDQAHFGDPTMDQVRAQEDLEAAITRFQRALAIQPSNATARQRLASIALARGGYPEALEQMEAAWAAGHRDSVTRLLYGDALVAAGEPERAADVARGLKWARARLEGQAWARYTLGNDPLRNYYAWKTITMIDPQDAGAKRKAVELENSIIPR